MQTIEYILKELVSDKYYYNLCISYSKNKSICDDLFHEVILGVYKYKESCIRAKENGYLKQYVSRIIHTVAFNPSAALAKYYENHDKAYNYIKERRHDDTVRDKHIQEQELIKFERNELNIHKKHLENMGSPYWYHANILKLYIELGSYRKVSNKTHIPYVSIYVTIKNYKETLKNESSNNSSARGGR